MWRFRERLKELELKEVLFDHFGDYLAAQGYQAKQAQIVDAFIVPVPIQRNSREENQRIKQGEVPEDWSEPKREQKDVQARWTKKHGKSNFGYDSHICEKGQAGQPVSPEQEAYNRQRSKVRSRVEHVSGFHQNSMGGKRIRTIGLTRAEVTIGLMNMTYNLMRYLQLTKRRERATAAA